MTIDKYCASPKFVEVGKKLKVRMFDKLWDAEIVEDSPYDPKNANIRVDCVEMLKAAE